VSQLSQAIFGQFIGIYDASTKDHKILPLPTLVLQAPLNASYNILLGIDFLKRFAQYCSDHSTIKLLTRCGHWVSAPIVSQRSILFPFTHAASMVITAIYPNKEVLINKTLSKMWFSKFDCKSRFYQIKLRDSAKPLTAFSNPSRTIYLECHANGTKKRPTNISTTTGQYISRLSRFLSNLCWWYTHHFFQHCGSCNTSTAVYSKKKRSWTNPFRQKSWIAKNQIEFLCLKIDKKGIEMQPHICEKITNFPDHLTDRK